MWNLKENKSKMMFVKSLTKIVVTFLLAIAMTLGAFNSHTPAHASPVSVSFDGNKTFDQINALLTYNQKFAIKIGNHTKFKLIRVATYNDTASWPLTNIEPETATVDNFNGTKGGFFSFASGYKVDVDDSYSFDGSFNNSSVTGITSYPFLNFAASWPILSPRKINSNLGKGVSAESDNQVYFDSLTYIIWDKMSDSNDKREEDRLLNLHSYLSQVGDTVVWNYDISPSTRKDSIYNSANPKT